jgi:SAM-dependent methyltransferase
MAKRSLEVKHDMKAYWDSHPIGVEGISKPLGSAEFYREYVSYYDEFYDYKWQTFQYDKYRGRKVLEIGCGLGIDSIKFAKGGAELTCIDLSDTSVRCTRQLLQQLDLSATVMQGDAENLTFRDASFDVVYAYGCLMLVQDEAKAFRELHRVLKPGGEALVVLYHRRSWYWMLVSLTGTRVESDAGDPPINRVHSLQEVRRLFSAFSEVDIRLDRLPRPTQRRRGPLAFLFNHVFVPVTRLIPQAWLQPFGWHIIIKAVK